MKGTRKKKRQCGHFTGETGRKGFGFRKNLQQNLGKSTGTKITALVNCKECVAIHRAHQEHVPNCMRPLINKKIKQLSELTEHSIADEIEAPKEILRKEFSYD